MSKAQFHAGDLSPALNERVGVGAPSGSLVAKRDLGRYYQVLADSMPRLTEGAAMAVCDALNGTVLDHRTYRHLWIDLEDWPAADLGRKWGIDGPALVAQLRALSPCALMAIVDAVERFWLHQEGRVAGEILREVGLVEPC